MADMSADFPAANDEEADPRLLRSRARLLDAAVDLLRTGGIDAVTIDAVTKASGVARTTLYRHFGCSSDLLAATLERLLPPVTPPPSTGSLRDRLVELVCRQATLYEEAPLHPTTLAWIALRSSADGAPDAQDCQRSNSALQARVVDHYRHPFEAILQSPEARAQLGDFDLELAVCQLVGPLLFAWMIGLRVIDHRDCARIVDDFLAATSPAGPRAPTRPGAGAVDRDSAPVPAATGSSARRRAR
jgi:TetR/AcrR family transcriptional regulator, regulator of autoinduction and epiphytic fitness